MSLILFFLPSKNSRIIDTLKRKIYLTDLESNLTFAGMVESFCEIKENINVTLSDVTVYDYSSSIPLYKLPSISLSRPKNKIFTEEIPNS